MEEEVTAHGCDRETESAEELGTSEEVTGRDPHPKAHAGITHTSDISLGPSQAVLCREGQDRAFLCVGWGSRLIHPHVVALGVVT